MVRTPVTVTLNSDSSAALICGLVAAMCTRNAYSLRVAYAADDFSVTTGPTISAWMSGIFRPFRAQRRQLDHHRVGPEDFVSRRVGEAQHLHRGQVAPRQVHVGRARRV